jgi:hypothetical protein
VIRRTFDPTFLNSVINHPQVRPWLKGEGVLDLAETAKSLDNYLLEAEGGGFVLIRHEPGIYEVHSQFLPEARGGTVAAMKAGFEYMFVHTDCQRVVTKVPDGNRAAVALAKLAGFRPMFRREETSFMGLTAEEWAQGNAELETDGRWFHEALEAAKREKGSDLPTHTDDPAHERAVGATVQMVKAGNAEKGVTLYNRWARLAGYVPVTLLSEQPVVIDVVDAVVGWSEGQMEVLLCR